MQFPSIFFAVCNIFVVVIVSIMASKRGRMSRGSSSRASPTPSPPTFLNLKFLYEAHAEKILKILDYHILKEIFDLNDL